MREAAINKALEYFDKGGLIDDLAQLVAIETESQAPEQRPQLYRYLTEQIQPRLESMGFTLEIHENAHPQGGPILLAQRIENPALPTVLTYGHGDVIRAQTDQWREGLHPFSLTVEDDRAYGRGTADNKVQHLINLMALKSIIDANGSLGFNVKLILEMSEEIGSPGLAEFCETHKDALRADVFIASDGPRLKPDRATMFMGSRGGMNFDLSVNLREGAHHSGNWGGVLADPAMRLAHALASICEPNGKINVPEWRPDSLTPKIKDVLQDLPMGDDGPEIDPNWGEPGLTAAEKLFGWNSFAVLAMNSGIPAAPVNAISGHATAHCQLRFVVGTDASEIIPGLRRFLDARGFRDVTITATKAAQFDATRVDPDDPWVGFVEKSLADSAGVRPHVLPNLAGSLPNECFSKILGLPTIWVPHSYTGCSQHAPNEHVLLPVCRDALALMTGLFADLATESRP